MTSGFALHHTEQAEPYLATKLVTASTLDEAPQAYKPMEEILSLIEPTVDITSIVKPKLNIKDLGV